MCIFNFIWFLHVIILFFFQPFDRAYVDNAGPMVVFATPGMLHSGLSVQIFRKWAPNENNMVSFFIFSYLMLFSIGMYLNFCIF